MYNLYHQMLCPFCRKVRFVLTEKGIDFELIEENLSERRPYFVALNPAVQVPVIENPETGEVVCGSDIICEYFEEKFSNQRELLEDGFVGRSPLERAEVRRIQSWFDDKFYNEVTKYILEEKLLRSVEDKTYTPNPKKLRAAYHNMNVHFDYIEYLLRKRKWLGGEFFSLADIAAAAQISSIDYFGDIDWEKRPRVKDWYSLVKSKKGFKSVLNDRVRGFKPPKWYDELDF